MGGMAILTLRKTRMPKSLVSGQMILTWGMIAVACLVNGINNQLLEVPLNTLVCSAALFLAIGFATTAGVIQKRLLAASLFLTIGSLVLAYWPAACDADLRNSLGCRVHWFWRVAPGGRWWRVRQ